MDERISNVPTGTFDILEYFPIDFRVQVNFPIRASLCDQASDIVALSLPYHPVFLYCGRRSGRELPPGG